MKILIDIGHPAHVHLFKHFAHEMKKKGHKVHFTVRDKEFETELLDKEGLEYTSLGKHYGSKTGKIFGLIKFTLRILRVGLRFKPDMFLSHGSIYAAFASVILRKPNISLEDTGNNEQVMLYLPFTKAVLTSTSFPKKYGSRQVWYEGYHELAYLHPKYFRPDPFVRKELGISDDDKYFILRFVSWKASHDIGIHGLSREHKRRIVEMLLPFGKVFISSEKEMDKDLEQYRFHLPPHRMHDALAFAELFIGEGVTMASEAAILGTPAVYINPLQRGYTTEQEQRYGLVYNFVDSKGVFERIESLLKDNEFGKKASLARQKLLSEKINLTAFLVWFAENWPESFRIVKKDPGYPARFR